jgi:hypothetical protein
MHMWRHVTNHLIISNDKDSNSENRIKLCIRDSPSLTKTWRVPFWTETYRDTITPHARADFGMDPEWWTILPPWRLPNTLSSIPTLPPLHF